MRVCREPHAVSLSARPFCCCQQAVKYGIEGRAQRALRFPAVAGPQMDVGPADEVEQDRGHLRRIDRAHGAIRGPVAQQLLEWLGEDRARQRFLGVLAVEDPIRLRAQRDEQGQFSSADAQSASSAMTSRSAPLPSLVNAGHIAAR
jgi:hypothetical protein